jgi:hypothetical protein
LELKDLGWANGWGEETPEIVRICRKLHHRPPDVDHSGNRGLDNQVTCRICGYTYHYDSSG